MQPEINDVARRAPSSEVEELEKALSGLTTSIVGTKSSSMSFYSVEERCCNILGALPEQMQKLTAVDDLTVHGAAGVETGATFTKLMTGVESVAETAEFIADVSKCVTGVSTIFHLVALRAQVVRMCVEAERGQRILPVALGQLTILLRHILASLAEVLKSSKIVHVSTIGFVFDVLKETMCTIDLAETQLLRGRGSEIMNAGDVREVERKIDALRQMAVIACNTSMICEIGEEVTELKKDLKTWENGPHHVRPSVSAFFSGRKKELNTLEDILEKRGSAVITQYGGVGKTELMAAFADQADREASVPGGVFWVTVDGDCRDVINSLAGLAEKLIGRKMGKEDRRNANLVIEELK